MLKIKSNTNKFTIIFSEKIWRKINAEKLSVQPSLFSTLSLFQPSFSFSFSAAHFLFFFFFFLMFPSQPPLFLLLFSSSAPPFLLFVFLLYSFVFIASFFFSSRRVALFLSAQKYFFQPKTFFTSAQNIFASAQNTFSVQPKNIIFSPIRFCFSPRYFFNSAQKSLPVCGSVPPSFCFFSSCLSFLPLATTYCPFSAQVFNSKPFSAASCLFIWVNLHFLQIWNKI